MTQAQRCAPHREWGLTRTARIGRAASRRRSDRTVTNFFGPGSPYLGHPLLTAERTSSEVDRILGWCSELPTDVLDLGCGFGRHSLEFARRGFAVTGVDPSAALLEEAHRRADGEALEIEFVQSGGQAFSRADSFDLAVCLFTTLGQLTDAKSDPQIGPLLSNLRTSLRPGGTLVVEVPERDRAVEQLVEREQLGPTKVGRSFNAQTGVLSERFETPDGTFDLAYSLLSEAELVSAIEAAGFTVAEIYDEAVNPPPNTFMTLVAR